jgi:hypothetical protein
MYDGKAAAFSKLSVSLSLAVVAFKGDEKP